MRVFIAINLPEDIKAKVFHEFEIVQNSGLVTGNFVEKENLHLSLKFLGEVSEEEIEKIKKKLSEIKFKKLDVEIGKIGFFPDENYIRVIWVDLIADELKKLNELVEKAMFALGFNEEKDFTSHITIARIKSIKNKDLLHEKLKKIKLKKLSFKINKFSLIKSELTPRGPVYKIIKEFELV